MTKTATTRHAILGLLALRPSWPIYELTQQLRRNMVFFWPRAESRIYAEAKRLAADGLVRATTDTSGRRRRTSYAISAAGRRRLREWFDATPKATTLECEPLLRVFLADFAEPEHIHAALERVRDDARAILEQGRTAGSEYLEGRGPFQDQVHVRGYVFDFLANFALFLQGWADRTESSYRRWPDMTEAERADAALELIRINLAKFPDPSG